MDSTTRVSFIDFGNAGEVAKLKIPVILVEFHPSSTAREVLELVKKKIGLQENAQGYAIYEVLGASERSLLPDEKVADVMSKWEKYRTAAAQAVQQSQAQTNGQPAGRRQHHLFLFKKHLFCDQYMNLEDPVEKELLYHQVLHGLRSERFPISEMEAVGSLDACLWIAKIYFLFSTFRSC